MLGTFEDAGCELDEGEEEDRLEEEQHDFGEGDGPGRLRALLLVGVVDENE